MNERQSINNEAERKPRVVKDKDTRTKEIIQAAKRLFLKKGFLTTTMEEIANEAKVARGTIYLYFDHKDDLYVSMMVPAIRSIGDRLLEIEERLDRRDFSTARDIILSFLNVYYLCYLDDPDGFSIFSTFQAFFFSRMSEEKLAKINDAGRRNSQITRRIISKCKAMGLLKKDLEEPLIADLLWGTFHGLLLTEELKKRVTHKDYVYKTLNQAFSYLADALTS